MDWLNEVWDYFGKLPLLLDQYAGYSTALLLVLLAMGGFGLIALFLTSRKKKTAFVDVNRGAMILCAGLVALSLGGFVLKTSGAHEQLKKALAFVADHKFGPNQYGIVVFNFHMPDSVDESRKKRMQDHMQLLGFTVTHVLEEDLPSEVTIPHVINLSTDGSPWQQEGVTQQNVAGVLEQLNALEVLWGTVYVGQNADGAKVFLGLHSSPRATLDLVHPLRDVLLDDDPRADQQFGEGRYQLLGTVALEIALQTIDDAHQKTGEDRKELLLKAAQEIARSREALNSRSQDPVLKRTLYSAQISTLLDTTLKEAGVQP